MVCWRNMVFSSHVYSFLEKMLRWLKMKNKFAIILLLIMLIVTSCAAIGMDNLPEGEWMETVSSLDGTYKVNSFLVSGNATTDFSVRCEVVVEATGEKRNIYWEYHCENAEIEWIDDTTVEINGKHLNVITDSYDWRNN